MLYLYLLRKDIQLEKTCKYLDFYYFIILLFYYFIILLFYYFIILFIWIANAMSYQ
jgi:hypothetical protein